MESALAFGEVDPGRMPGRRGGVAILSGVLVAALGLAGFAVWGLLQPGGSTRWRAGDAVIIERESGAKYVYLDGRLHPVANYASALLVIGAPRPATVLVARRSLAGAARGAPLGIVGAPDALPTRGELVRGPWHVCGREDATSTVVIAGSNPVGGTPLGSSGLLAQTPDGATYLVWRGARARLREPEQLRAILVWGAPVAVAPGLIGTLPALPDIARVPVAGRGQPFAPLPGTRIGQVFVVGGRQHVVALAGGLAPLTGLQAALLTGDPATVELVRQKAPTPLSAGEYAAAPKATLPGVWTGLPTELPQLVSGGGAVCLAVGGDVAVGARVPAGDRVALPAGRGALVEAMPAPDAPVGVVHLVIDSGVRYPVVSTEVLEMLGYRGASPTRLPAEIVGLLPAGATLDPQAARTPLSS